MERGLNSHSWGPGRGSSPPLLTLGPLAPVDWPPVCRLASASVPVLWPGHTASPTHQHCPAAGFSGFPATWHQVRGHLLLGTSGSSPGDPTPELLAEGRRILCSFSSSSSPLTLKAHPLGPDICPCIHFSLLKITVLNALINP